MDDSFNSKLLNYISSINYDSKVCFKDVVKSFRKIINDSFKTLVKANELDIKNNNGFKLSLDIINKIIDRALGEDYQFGDVLVSMESEDENFIYGKQVMCTGNVLLISDGNTYGVIDMIVKNILVNNALFLVSEGFMHASNSCVIKLFKKVLRQYRISEYQIESIVSDNLEVILSNFTSFDLVVCLGNKNLQLSTFKYAKNRVLVSGYEYYDLYIETTDYNDFIKKIIDSGVNVTIYVKNGLEGNFLDEIVVSDIEEAIAQINFSGARYSSSIFTSSNASAVKFLREVKSNHVLINTSPTIERIFDISVRDLSNIKTMVYPVNYKFDKNLISTSSNELRW